MFTSSLCPHDGTVQVCHFSVCVLLSLKGMQQQERVLKMLSTGPLSPDKLLGTLGIVNMQRC